MRAPIELADDPLLERVQEWAAGRATLKDLRGYTADELSAIARSAHVFYCQGRIEPARVLFQGLRAVDPLNPYFARAVAVVEFAAGNREAALVAWDAAVALDPVDPSAWVGRAEVKLAWGDRAQAVSDLRRAQAIARSGHPLRAKIDALLRRLTLR